MPTYAQIQAMRAKAQGNAYKPPKKTGSRDPYNALGGFTDLQGAYLDAVGRGPNYSGIEPIDFDALQRLAETSATKRIQPFIDQVQDERGYQNARRDVSNQAATNFTQAISGLFTGGRGIDDPEGQKHSLENFGGSYLGGMAAMLGQQLMAQIGHSFTDQDHELANRISLLMDKHPEEAEKIYADLVAGEEARVKEGKSIVDADFRSQIAARGAAVKFERDNMKGGAAGRPYVSYFTDPASGARMGVRPDGSVVPISGAVAEEPMSASQVSSLLRDADTIVSESVNNGATFKDALLQARMYLRDNGVKNYGQWAPYTTPAGPKAKGKSQNFKMGDGSIWRVNPDGTTTQIKSAGNTGKTGKGGADAPSPTQISTTTARATKAGEAVLEKVTDNIWAKMPGSAAEKGTDEYTRAEAAYNSYLDSGKSFGTAMAKVIAAISPHLKAIGYKSSQIRRVAYQIVTQQIDPPRGYKAPGAR